MSRLIILTIILGFSIPVHSQTWLDSHYRRKVKLKGVKEVVIYLKDRKFEHKNYNRDGTLSKVTQYDTGYESRFGKVNWVFEYSYNKSNRNSLIKVYDGSGTFRYWHKYYYDNSLKIISVSHHTVNSKNYSISKYYYDNQGKIEKIDEYDEYSQLIYSLLFEYDNNRIKFYKVLNKMGSTEAVWHYTYDDNGLIALKTKKDPQRADEIVYSYKYTLYTLTEEIKDIVQYKVNSWQKKGKFESLDSYQTRVNTATRIEFVKSSIQTTIDSLASLYSWIINSTDYDVENEVYVIDFENFGVIYLDIPRNKVEDFDKNITKCKFKNAKFSLNNDFFSIKSVDVKLKKEMYNYSRDQQITFNSSDFDLNFNTIEISLPYEKESISTKVISQKQFIRSDVDEDIPKNKITYKSKYALIIGNEDYSSFQTGLSTEINVEFAQNDAIVFNEYCINTLGIPEKQIKLLINGTSGQMNQAISWLTNLIDIEDGNADVIFYYSGHGLPDENNKEPYLIPVDISGYNVNQGIQLSTLFKKLSEHKSRRVTVILDACFSGGSRNKGLVAMKGVRIKPKENLINGNMVVFASSSGNESSGVYREKQHGYLTYYLLKKLQETRGNINYKSLADYIIENVKKESALEGKIQTPQIILSNAIKNEWEEWRINR